jgi:hypothetical protein
MPKRYNNIIYKLFLGIKKIIKVILSSMTRIGLIVCIEDPKKTPGVNYVHIEEGTKVEETTIVDIITTTHFIKSDATSITNLDISQASIQ